MLAVDKPLAILCEIDQIGARASQWRHFKAIRSVGYWRNYFQNYSYIYNDRMEVISMIMIINLVEKMDVRKVLVWVTLSFLLGNGVAFADYKSAYSAYEAKDYKTAFKAMLPLAEKGNLDAQFHIATMYYDGLGVKKDRSISVVWLTKVAIRGDMYAQALLADRYFFGVGAEKNDKTAVKWYTKSAEQGYGFAQVSLGHMYDKGRGVLTDFVRGYMWYNLGAYNGGFRGGKEVESIAKKMTITQIAKAQEMSNRCLESNYTDC